jgi:dCTP deaminase
VAKSRPKLPLLKGAVLSKPDILARIENGSLSFSPELGPKAVKQCSIDLRLAPIFTRFRKKENLHIGSLDIENVDAAFNAPDLWRIEEDTETCLLKQGEFVLSQTLETVTMPLDLMGLVEGRSSWARFGVSVHVTAPKIDPGFSAPITLEFTNHGSVDILLTAIKNRPCQLMLLTLSTPLDSSAGYGTSADDIFAGQTKPIPSKKGKNK